MSKRTCSVDGCDVKHAAKGYCLSHYMKWRKYGDPLVHVGTGNTAESKPCIVDGCERISRTKKGMCRSHNQTYFRYGTTTPTVESYLQRLMTFVRVADSGCWEWTGATMGSHNSYGQFSMRGIGRPTCYAHRAAYELMRGPIPDGLTIDHLCFNTLCVNPDHLEPVTQLENNRRWAATITHCPQGHEYDEQNTGHSGNSRQCRACRRDAERVRRAKRKAAKT